MNPWALVVIGLGVFLLIMGITGSYSEVKKALTGKPANVQTPSPGGTPGMPISPGNPAFRLTGPRLLQQQQQSGP